MSSTQGPGLKERDHGWLPDNLEKATLEKDMDSLCEQLDQMLSSLRQLEQRDEFIGSITRGPLLDRVFINFTHADVHPTNIMVSAALDLGPPRILALIDWGQAGWYPHFWEYFKMCYTTDPEGVWRKTYVPKIIKPWEYEHYLLAEYAMGIGAI